MSDQTTTKPKRKYMTGKRIAEEFLLKYGPDYWRDPFPWTAETAKKCRTYLVALHFYPTGMISRDPGFEGEEQNNRKHLHTLVDELGREDLRALYDTAKVMAAFPDQAQMFTELAHKRGEETAAWVTANWKTIKKQLKAKELADREAEAGEQPAH